MTYSIFTTDAIRQTILATFDLTIEVEDEQQQVCRDYTSSERAALLNTVLSGEAMGHTVSQMDDIYLCNAVEMAVKRGDITREQKYAVDAFLQDIYIDWKDIEADLDTPCDTGQKATGVAVQTLDEAAEAYVSMALDRFEGFIDDVVDGSSQLTESKDSALRLMKAEGDLDGMVQDAYDRAILMAAEDIKERRWAFKLINHLDGLWYNSSVDADNGTVLEDGIDIFPCVDIFFDVARDTFDGILDDDDYATIKGYYAEKAKQAKKVVMLSEYQLGHPFASHS